MRKKSAVSVALAVAGVLLGAAPAAGAHDRGDRGDRTLWASPSGGSGACTRWAPCSLQNAVAAAGPGQQVFALPGIYHGGVVLDQAIDLRGFGAVIDASSSPNGNGVQIVGPGGSGSSVEGFKIENAQFEAILVGTAPVDPSSTDGTPVTSGAAGHGRAHRAQQHRGQRRGLRRQGRAVRDNFARGNGLGGVTIHQHLAGDLNGNVVEDNTLINDNLAPDQDFANVFDPVTTGILVESGPPPSAALPPFLVPRKIENTVIRSNRLFANSLGIFTLGVDMATTTITTTSSVPASRRSASTESKMS